ncbi:MAG: MBL fold metallo-hydrolase [Lachnospiraceae bacterium]|nr:MBL fold metallo-hydrolase [Lachnospiraceae bacterium]
MEFSMKNLDITKIIVGPVRTNCYLVRRVDSDKVIIIDPGDEADIIERKILTKALKPIAILLTHGHFDHIGAVDTLRTRFGIKSYMLEQEKDVINSEANLGRAFGIPTTGHADILVKEGDEITLDEITFKVIHTPGHTIGSCCYLVEAEKVLFSGDTLFYHSHGRTDFPTGSESAIIRSITEKLLVLDSDTVVYPGHEMDTTIGQEKALYDFY